MNKTKIFFDFEATSVARDADMISVGLVAVIETQVKQLWVESLDSKTGWISDDNWYESNTGEFVVSGNDGSITDIEYDKYYNPVKGVYLKTKTFYAEFTDFNIEKCDDWVKENVVAKLHLKHFLNVEDITPHNRICKGHKEFVSTQLKKWLFQFESIEFWCDFGVVDTPMLIDLIADWDTKEEDIVFTVGEYQTIKTVSNKIGLPKHLPNVSYYDFYDIHTLFKIKGVDPDIDREEFTHGYKSESYFCPEFLINTGKHNALWDAYVTWLCYDKLTSR